jgi:hypothetical protein
MRAGHYFWIGLFGIALVVAWGLRAIDLLIHK